MQLNRLQVQTFLTISLLVLCCQPLVLFASTMELTAEGQIGELPEPGTHIIGSRFGLLAEGREIMLATGLEESESLVDLVLSIDRFDGLSASELVLREARTVEEVVFLLEAISKNKDVARKRGKGLTVSDIVAFSFGSDGSNAGTMKIDILTFDGRGTPLASRALDDISTFPIIPPEPSLAVTAITVDNQGQITVMYTQRSNNIPQITAQRLDAVTGQLLGDSFPVGDGPNITPDIALLDPAGNRLLVAGFSINTNAIHGSFIDTTGSTPVVSTDFTISTTPGDPSFPSNINPVLATDPSTGSFMVVWQHFATGAPVNDPANIRGRRFDAAGNPIGNDFIVNETVAGTQGQPAIDISQDGYAAVVWAGTGDTAAEDLDIFLQVYDPQGDPIDGEIKVNTNTTERQDRPTVRFLPDPDNQDRKQFVVVYRDVVSSSDNTPNGTGTSYSCFSINGTGSSKIGGNNVLLTDNFERPESPNVPNWCDDQT